MNVNSVRQPGNLNKLSSKEIALYRENGQVEPVWRLPDDLLSRMRDSLDRLGTARDDTRPDFIALPHVPWEGPGGTEIAHEFFDYVTNPQLIDLVEQVIGPDIVMWASSVFCKPAGRGLEVPWHQDGQYWPIRPSATITVWIALDDVTVANGCMKIIPGSHLMANSAMK